MECCSEESVLARANALLQSGQITEPQFDELLSRAWTGDEEAGSSSSTHSVPTSGVDDGAARRQRLAAEEARVATRMQAAARRYLARAAFKKAMDAKEAIYRRRKAQACLVVQAARRGAVGRSLAAAARIERGKRDAQRQAAAERLQAVAHGLSARKRLHASRDAAVKLQAGGRRLCAKADARLRAQKKAEAEAARRAAAQKAAAEKAAAEKAAAEAEGAGLKAEAEAKAKANAEAEAKAKAEAEAARLKAQAEAEAKVRAEAEAARLRAEAEARAAAEKAAKAASVRPLHPPPLRRGARLDQRLPRLLAAHQPYRHHRIRKVLLKRLEHGFACSSACARDKHPHCVNAGEGGE